MAIIWLNIWNMQSSTNIKGLINRCFNVGSFIVIVCRANRNLGVSQYKKCWKWGHITYSYRVQRSKYIKYNSPHMSKHHCQFFWCCKANPKINSLRLKTKQGKPCPHLFRCLNCKEDYQANSNLCPFWKYCFNREWHSKKYQKLYKSRRQSIHSVVNGNLS